MSTDRIKPPGLAGRKAETASTPVVVAAPWKLGLLIEIDGMLVLDRTRCDAGRPIRP